MSLGYRGCSNGDRLVSETVPFVDPECHIQSKTFTTSTYIYLSQELAPPTDAPNVYLCVRMCTFVHMHAFVCTCMWRPEDKLRCHSLSANYLIFSNFYFSFVMGEWLSVCRP